MHIDRYYSNLERGNTVWPDDAIGIIILFYCSGHNTTNANTIAAHAHKSLFAIFIKHGGLHCLAVFGTQLKYMADFNAAFYFKDTLSIGARVAGDNIANVGNTVFATVSIPVNIGQVVAVAVCATSKVAQLSGAVVDHDRKGQANRAQGTRRAMDGSFDLCFSGKGDLGLQS